MRANEFVTERKKHKRKSRYAAYGPGPYGGYGYYAGYSGDSSGGGDAGGDGGGGGESIKNEDAMMAKIEGDGKIVRILKKQHSVPFSDEKNWLLIDTDPAKGNKGLGLKWIPADTRFTWVRPYRDTIEQGVAEGFDKEAEAYKSHLLKTAPKVMNFLAKAVKGWRPSEEEMLGAIDTGYMVMKHTGDVKQAGKAMMDELNTLHRMSQGQQGVAENFADGKNPQDKGDSKRHGVPTKASVSTLRKVAKQGGRKGQLAHWMANMKSGRSKKK